MATAPSVVGRMSVSSPGNRHGYGGGLRPARHKVSPRRVTASYAILPGVLPHERDRRTRNLGRSCG
jgi:hypothetical protein